MAAGAEELELALHQSIRGAVEAAWNTDFDEALDRLVPSSEGAVKFESPRVLLARAQVPLLRSYITGRNEDKKLALQLMGEAVEAAAKAVKGSEVWRRKVHGKKARSKSKIPFQKPASIDSGSGASSGLLGALSYADASAPVFERMLYALAQESECPGDADDETWSRVLVDNLAWDQRLVMGSARLYQATLQMSMGNRVKGLYQMRKSWKVFRALRRDLDATEVPVSKEVRLGVHYGRGLFLFLVSMAPAGIASALLRLIGFEADRQLGLNHLRAVAGSTRGIDNAFATAALCGNFLYLPRGFGDNREMLREAERVLDTALERHPTCSLFFMFRNQLGRKLGDPAMALEAAQAAVDVATDHGITQCSIYRSERASAHMLALEWQAAVNGFADLLEDDEFEIQGLVCLCMASVLAQNGDIAAAQMTLMRVEDLYARQSRFDKLASELAQACMDVGPHDVLLLTFVILYLKRELKPLQGEALQRMADALDSAVARIIDGTPALADADADAAPNDLPPLPLAHWTPDMTAEVDLIRGVIAMNAHDTDAAVARFQSVVRASPHVTHHTWLYPHALFEMAEIAFLAGDLDMAETRLNTIAKCKGYQWKAALDLRVKQSRKLIHQARNPSADPSLAPLPFSPSSSSSSLDNND